MMMQEDNKLEIEIFAKRMITSQTKTKTREFKLEEKQYEPYSKVTLYIFTGMHTVCEVFVYFFHLFRIQAPCHFN